MRVQSSTSRVWPRRGIQPPTAFVLFTVLPGLCAATMLMWSYGHSTVVSYQPASHQPAKDQPTGITLRDGFATVDVHLEQDVPVRLLVSNLGSANRNAILQATATSIPYDAVTKSRGHCSPVLSVNAAISPSPATTATLVALSDSASGSTKPPPRSQSTGSPPPTREFWLHVTETPLENPKGYQLVRGQLTGSDQLVEVYADVSLSTPSGFPATIRQLATEIASRLSQYVLPAVEQHVGPIADPDQNGRLTVLLTPWLGRLRGGTTQVRGFVRSSDLRTDISAPFSNRADLLYLNSDLPTGEMLQSLLLHEVAHTALASRQSVTSGRALPDWDDWLNEGLAHLTEQHGRDEPSNLDFRVARYWQNSAAAPLAVRDYYRTGRWRNHGCRGATFLFLDWCQHQSRQRGTPDFIAALMATGKSDAAALEQVCQAKFPDLYRAWTISLATRDTAPHAARVGRYLNSGVRFQHWNLAADSKREFDVAGTATQFVELRPPRAGWYRLIFSAEPLDAWQLTVVPGRQGLPGITVNAKWSRVQASEPRLIVDVLQPLPAGWSAEEISCEMIREPQPRVWIWPVAALEQAANAGGAMVLPLSPEDLTGGEAVIKVRFKNAAGQSAWGWSDLPAGLAVEQIASGSRAF
jgi:hypothetical protein